MQELLEKAYNIAQTYDVSTAKDCAVVYSISYMPNEENKQKALVLVSSDTNYKMLDDTDCGQALINLGLNGKVDEVGIEITKIWHMASSRYISKAFGNITAFVDGADIRSTFCTIELGEILKNPNITHINGIEKNIFAENFKPQRY